MIQYILYMICVSLCCVLIAYIIAKGIEYITDYIFGDLNKRY